MKKILFPLLAVGSLMLASNQKAEAQTGYYPLLSQYSNPTDTVLNVSVKNLTLKTQGYMKTVAISFNAVSLSGTLAGTAQLQGTVDGVNYYPVVLANGQTNSFTITNVANQGAVWYIVDSPFQGYRVAVSGTGATEQMIISGGILNRFSS